MKNSKLVIFGILFLGILLLSVAWWGISGQGNVNSTTDVVQCPVMKTQLHQSDAFDSTEYKGKTYYFCCGGCPGEFEKNPDKYVK